MPPRPAFRLLAPIAGGGLAATLLAGLLVPVYTDEVGWRHQLDRMPFDGGVDRGLTDQCGPSTTVVPPWFMRPVRELTAFVDGAVADPRMVRLLGVALALLAVGLLAAVARAAGNGRRSATLAVGYALLGLGTLPFLLVWHRPEQPILLAILAAVLIVLRVPAGAWAAIWSALAVLLLGVLVLAEHPKGVAFAPILIVAALLAGRGRDGLAARIAAAGALTALAPVAFGYWQARFACPGDPAIAAHNAWENVFSAGAGRGPLALLRAMAAQMWPTDYLRQIGPGPPQMMNWLPPVPGDPHAFRVWARVLRTAWRVLLVAGVAAGALLVARGWRERRLDPRLALALVIVACVFGWGGTQVNKNAYEATLILPLLVVALLLVLPGATARWPRLAWPVAAVFTALALASEALLLAIYLPPLSAMAAHPGARTDIPASFTPWDYARAAPAIRAAGRRCGIEEASARYLMVDDLTYWPYLRSYRPFNRLMVLQAWIPTSRDPLGYLRAHGSSGVVMQCALLPPGLRARATASGRFCCIGAP